jgi:hypothetical protein
MLRQYGGGIHLAWNRVQYRAVVNSKLDNTLTVEKTGHFLIGLLFKMTFT